MSRRKRHENQRHRLLIIIHIIFTGKYVVIKTAIKHGSHARQIYIVVTDPHGANHTYGVQNTGT